MSRTVQYFSVQLLLHSTLYYLRSDVDFELFFPLNNDNTCPVLCILILTPSKSAVSFDVLFMRSERCLDLPYDPHSMCDKCKHQHMSSHAQEFSNQINQISNQCKYCDMYVYMSTDVQL